jgi:hypothetical protein
MQVAELTADDDTGWVFDVVERWARCYRWSLRGQTPSPALIEQLLSAGVALRRMILTPEGLPAALVQVADVDRDNGHAQLGLLVDPGRVADVGPSIRIVVDDAFELLDLRKLCLAVEEGVLDVPTAIGESACQIGRLRAHERRADGGYIDVLVYEIWRDGA